MKTAIYARVSTDKQNHDSQLNELRDYCRRRGWSNVVEHLDQVSGAKFSRAGLDVMMAQVRKGKLDVVLVFRLDRLGRSLAHLAQIIGELQTHRVALVVPGQGIDTSSSNPASQLQLNILAAIAEFERAIITERVQAGLKAARARGAKLGRPSTHQGKRDAVQALRAQGMSIRAIAAELGINKTTVSQLIQV